MILEVSPGLPDDFEIPAGTTTVQFCRRLGERDYATLSRAMECKPTVRLRIYHAGPKEFTDLEVLRYFSFVEDLSIELYWLTNLDGFAAIRSLNRLTLGRTDAKSFSLRFLGRYRNLRHLSLEGHKKDIDVLCDLTDLERLTLRSITLPQIDFLERLPRLRHLEIKLGGTSNLAALPKLNALEYLELWRIRGASDLAIIGELESLKYLFLQTLNKVQELPSFRKLANLIAVYIETLKGVHDVRPVADAPRVESVKLIDMPNISVENLRCFLNHPTLREFFAGLGSLKRNDEAAALIGLPRGRNWRQITGA
jgi:hypothetical protein